MKNVRALKPAPGEGTRHLFTNNQCSCAQEKESENALSQLHELTFSVICMNVLQNLEPTQSDRRVICVDDLYILSHQEQAQQYNSSHQGQAAQAIVQGDRKVLFLYHLGSTLSTTTR
jgi:hypothetical protein